MAGGCKPTPTKERKARQWPAGHGRHAPARMAMWRLFKAFFSQQTLLPALRQCKRPRHGQVHQRMGPSGTLAEGGRTNPLSPLRGSAGECAEGGPQCVGDGASEAAECHSGGLPRELHHDFARAGEAGGGGNEASSTAGTETGPGKGSLQNAPSRQARGHWRTLAKPRRCLLQHRRRLCKPRQTSRT